jgi:hypothetical protein
MRCVRTSAAHYPQSKTAKTVVPRPVRPTSRSGGSSRSPLSSARPPYDGQAEEILLLNALGNIGDFVGGIGVVVTLIYLAVQIRQNNRQLETNTAATQASAYQAELAQTRSRNMEFVRDRKMAEWAFLDSTEGLDPIDKFRVEVLWLDNFRGRQHLFIQAQDGLIRPDLMKTHDSALLGLFANPVVRDFWTRRSDQFVPEFVQHVATLRSARDSDSQPEPYLRE